MATGASKFVPNPDFVALMKEEPTYLAAMNIIANQVADEARATAPYDDGEYRDSIAVSGSTVGAGNDTAFYAWILEYGSVNTPVFATMRSAVKSLGLGLVEDHSEDDESLIDELRSQAA